MEKIYRHILNAGYEEAKVIFNSKGFPGYKLVGKEGSKNFWLIVQHCDKWPEFQTKALKAI